MSKLGEKAVEVFKESAGELVEKPVHLPNQAGNRPVPASGSCPASHPNKIGNRCLSNSAMRFVRREMEEANKEVNAGDLTAAKDRIVKLESEVTEDGEGDR